ncbi:MAG: LLM class flavin-dependent oxidoreductase [Alphaproteobacteria bacterium]|nr:LLM class flavin-dependent oxidoreductase [Alphaproteobacteria bacterium]
MTEFSVFFIGPTAGQGSEGEVQQAMLREGRLAEKLGFDAIWLAEHHFDATFSTLPSPNLLMAALSQITERVKLGCAINVLPFHHPLRIAEEGAMLDGLSNGRFQWGIGRGITGHEFHSFGLPPAKSRQTFNEIHDAVIGAWTTGRMHYEGEVVRVPPTDLAPNVVQRPHPPVWVTAQSPDSVAWAAQHDYPAMQIGESLAVGAEQKQRYRDAAKAAGVTTKRGGIVPLRMVHVAKSDTAAKEEAAERVLYFWDHAARTTAPNYKSPGPAKDQVGYEYWLTNNPGRHGVLSYESLCEAGLVIAGSPETVARGIQAQIDHLECSHIMCDFWRPSGMDKREESMRLFAEEVMPAFKGRARAAAA